MSIFGWGFSASKLKPQLKMAVHRISIASNKKSAISKQNMRQVALLLAECPPKEEKAKIRAEALIRDDNLIEAYEIIQLECELLSERIKLIEHSQSCPPDMLSCVSTLIYAANRVDIPELQEIRKLLRSKYGKKFEESAMRNAAGIINERVVSKLSVHPPVAYLVQTYLEKICEQFEVDWRPAIKLSVEQMIQPTAAPVGYSVQVAQGTGLGTNITNGGDYRNTAAAGVGYEQGGKTDPLDYSPSIIVSATSAEEDIIIPPIAPGQTSSFQNPQPIVMATPEYPRNKNESHTEPEISIPPAARSPTGKFCGMSALTDPYIPPSAPAAPSAERNFIDDLPSIPSAPAVTPAAPSAEHNFPDDLPSIPSAPTVSLHGNTNVTDDGKNAPKKSVSDDHVVDNVVDKGDDDIQSGASAGDSLSFRDLEARFNALGK